MLQDVIAKARESAKETLKSLYDDECSVTIFTPVLNEDTGVTEAAETLLYENIPCRISYNSNASAGDGEAPAIECDATLFLSPDIDIPAGSKISVTRQGAATDYHRSGVPAVYATHQEIKLKLYEDYA